MRRREFITALGGAAVAWPLAARAQRGGIVPKIGVLSVGTVASSGHLVDAFVHGLRERGYVESNVPRVGRIAGWHYRWDQRADSARAGKKPCACAGGAAQ